MAEDGAGNDALNAVLFIVYILLFLIAVWFVTGGPKRTDIHSIFVAPPYPFGTSSSISLPSVSFGDTPGVTFGQGFDGGGYGGFREGLSDSDREIFGLDALPTSPYAGVVRLESGGSSWAQSASDEYVVIRYSSQAQGKLVISGFKLQSAINKRTAIIYQGVEVYSPRVNPWTNVIALSPGDIALVSSGRSPIGVSFKVNKCTGYLSQFQEFSPQLSQDCPAPLDEARRARMGGSPQDADCLSYISTVGQCRIATDAPHSASDSCQSFAANTLTYAGCVDAHIQDADFLKPEWRIFLNSSDTLWREDREVLTLLDADGKLIDAIVF